MGFEPDETKSQSRVIFRIHFIILHPSVSDSQTVSSFQISRQNLYVNSFIPIITCPVHVTLRDLLQITRDGF